MKVFGFLVDWVSSNYQLTIWVGVSRFCRAHNVNLVTLVSGRPGSMERWGWARSELVRSIETQHFDGFLVMTATLLTTLGPDLEKQLREMTAPAPVVSFGEPLQGCPTIAVDNRQGFLRLLEHLVGHGHRRFAYAGGPPANRDARERRDLLVEFLIAHGLDVREDRILEGQFSAAWGMEAVARLVPGERPDFDVLVCANDEIATGALEAFGLKNLQVPGDVALTGFDDALSASQAGLTTARQPLADLGWRAAELLWEQLEGHAVPELTRRETELVVRQTCGCLSLAAQLAQAGSAATRGPKLSASTKKAPSRLLEELTREGLPLEHCSTLANLFLENWRSADSHGFLHSLRHLLSDMRGMDLPAGLLHYPLSVLRQWALRGSTSVHDRDSVETAVHQARILLSEVVHARSVQEGTHQVLIKELLNVLNQRLTNFGNLKELGEALDDLLPKLGVQRFWLSLHDAPTLKAEPLTQPWATVGEALLDRDGPVGSFVIEVDKDPEVLLVFSQLCDRIGRGLATIRRIQSLEETVARRTEELRRALKTVEDSNLHLKDVALHDELTSLYNRRGFMTLAEHRLKAKAGRTRHMTLFFGDLDGLKAINDTHGHDAGDVAIRTAARLLTDTFRAEDVVARLGGDEFVILAPDCSSADASGLAERTSAAFAAEGSGYSISLGWIVIDPKKKKPLSEAMKAADEALYREKQAKRSARTASPYAK